MAYQDIASFRNAARRDASALENVKLFLREPLAGTLLPQLHKKLAKRLKTPVSIE
jgi:hypothetical protein